MAAWTPPDHDNELRALVASLSDSADTLGNISAFLGALMDTNVPSMLAGALMVEGEDKDVARAEQSRIRRETLAAMDGLSAATSAVRLMSDILNSDVARIEELRSARRRGLRVD